MSTQLDNLRTLAKNLKKKQSDRITGNQRVTKVITVSSGKGGVGKTNFTLNLGIALQELGKSVLILDADLGLANIDVILGLSPKYNLYHVIKEGKSLKETISKGPKDLMVIPGGSGFEELANLSEWEVEHLLAKLSQVDGEFDFLLIDTGAGIAKNIIKFALAADEVIIVTTPEPTSLTDAYSLIKSLGAYNIPKIINVVVNKAETSFEGNISFNKLRAVVNKFLNINVDMLGYISNDKNVSQSVKLQQPFILAYPKSPASLDLYKIAIKLSNSDESMMPSSQGVKNFFTKIVSFMKN